MRCYNSYRFRLVSISCDPNFLFSIDGHQMTVIEVEGTNVQPVLVDGVRLFAGARGLNPFILFYYSIPNRSTLLGCCKMLYSLLHRMACLTHL